MNKPTASADSQQSLSANDSSSSFSDIGKSKLSIKYLTFSLVINFINIIILFLDSLTHSELENAYLDEASNFNGSKT